LIHPLYPRLIWVNITSDDGVTGHGETFFGPESVEAFIHNDIASYLLGKDPNKLDRHWREINRLGITNRSRGTEMRALSAVDMALWDLYARRIGAPLYQVLGGLTRDRIRVYNTCAGNTYGRAAPGMNRRAYLNPEQGGPLEDMHAFLTDAGALAEELLEEGITAMKIWPFDQFAEENNGQHLTPEQLDEGAEPFRKIRAAVGDKMDVALEMHSIWNLPTAIQIARKVAPFNPMWFEDPVRMDNIDALADFRRHVDHPVTASEMVATRWHFREMLDRRAMDVCMFDICWVGGISEAKRVASMAEAYYVPISPHDASGPINVIAGAHVMMGVPNFYKLETTRYDLSGYDMMIDHPLDIRDGDLYVSDRPGLGVNLDPDFLAAHEIDPTEDFAGKHPDGG
ncbi:MAG: mandelate racemase/muconate lactonizing enzyme family protein, partial [Proteobacteria bacterium]|nr:mandelate racemase/muconate lactonizing enzyme family protein [Pseudomonadota bacterium]